MKEYDSILDKVRQSQQQDNIDIEEKYQTLNASKEEAKRLNDEFIGSEHLLIAIMQETEGK